MKLNRIAIAFIVGALGGLPVLAQSPSAPSPASQQKMSPRAEAYYNFTLGHIYEQQYELTSQNDFATKAIEAYKKAYAIDPQSPIIGERLAEMYWKAQRVHDAMVEANEILKRDPNDLATHRLLARIYLRSLGDINGSGVQTEMVSKAIAEYSEVHRLDPTDQEAALWLARLFRLHNDPDKAEQVLRGLLKDDPENEAAVEQLTQLYLDESKSEEAISLLESMIARSPTPTLYDLLGDAYTQTHEYAQAEKAYRSAVDLDPSELGHLRGLGQALLSEEKYPEALSVYQKLSDLMPDDADVYLRLAQIYRELHQLDKAEEKHREGPAVRCRDAGSDVQRSDDLRSAGTLRGRHYLCAVRCSDGNQDAVHGVAFATQVAGHSGDWAGSTTDSNNYQQAILHVSRRVTWAMKKTGAHAC